MKNEKPKIRYPKLKDFIKSFYANSKVIFPCLHCEGKGSYYDPDDPPDPIEGYKLCRRITCKECGGTGEGDFEPINKEWEKTKKKDLEEIQNWEYQKLKYESICDKLDKGELEFLRKYIRKYEDV